MKVIKYKFLSCEINHGTEEEPNIEKVYENAEIECATQSIYDANYPIAEIEAVGDINVIGEFDPDPEEATDDVLTALLGV